MCGISIPSSRSTRNKSCSIWWRRSRPSNSESAGKRRENKRKSRGSGQESGKVSVLTSFHAKARTRRQAFINDITYDIIRRKHGYDRRIARGLPATLATCDFVMPIGCVGHILVSRERTVRIMCSKRPGKAIRASISKIVKGSSRHIRFRNCFEQSTLWRC